MKGADTFHVGGNTPEVDMAILASCNASIICKLNSKRLKLTKYPVIFEWTAYGTFGLWSLGLNVILILLIEVSKLLRFLFSISEYLQMTWLPVSRMWVAVVAARA